jgi:hypothetical protein
MGLNVLILFYAVTKTCKKKVTELKSKIKVHLLKVYPTLLSTEFLPATGNGYAAMI